MFALQHSAIGADVASQQKKKSQHVLMGENEQRFSLLSLSYVCKELGREIFFPFVFFFSTLPIGFRSICILGYQAYEKCSSLFSVCCGLTCQVTQHCTHSH